MKCRHCERKLGNWEREDECLDRTACILRDRRASIELRAAARAIRDLCVLWSSRDADAQQAPADAEDLPAELDARLDAGDLFRPWEMDATRPW